MPRLDRGRPIVCPRALFQLSSKESPLSEIVLTLERDMPRDGGAMAGLAPDPIRIQEFRKMHGGGVRTDPHFRSDAGSRRAVGMVEEGEDPAFNFRPFGGVHKALPDVFDELIHIIKLGPRWTPRTGGRCSWRLKVHLMGNVA
jgi:hypothetical protein